MPDEDKPFGRPSVYKEEFSKQAEKLALIGATDSEIADFFEVDVRTIYRWKHVHDDFCQALKIGKDVCDDRIERSLYQKASGYEFTEQQAFKVKVGKDQEEIEIVDVERHQPADTTAAIFWLKNRRPDDWRDKKEIDNNLKADHTIASLMGRIATRGRDSEG